MCCRNINPNEPTGIHLMRSKSPRWSAAAVQARRFCRTPLLGSQYQPSLRFTLLHPPAPIAPGTCSRRQLLVQFTTRDAQQPVAKYGRKPGAPEYLVPAATATYGRADMCGAPATTLGFLDPGLLHTAALSGLEPGQRYYYSVGDAVSQLLLLLQVPLLLLTESHFGSSGSGSGSSTPSLACLPACPSLAWCSPAASSAPNFPSERRPWLAPVLPCTSWRWPIREWVSSPRLAFRSCWLCCGCGCACACGCAEARQLPAAICTAALYTSRLPCR